MITRRETAQKGETAQREVTREVLAERVALRVGLDPDSATKIVGTLLDILQEALLAGERVNLDGLLDLGVVVEPARIRQEPGGRFSEIAPARSRLDVQVRGELRDRLATQRTAAILMAMPGDSPFAQLLSEHFSKLGWQVQRAETLEACRTLLSSARPYLLLCDHSLEGRDEFVAELKCGWRTNLVPVVTLHTRDEDLDRPEHFTVMGQLQAFEPIAVHPFLGAVDALLARSSEEAAIFERQLEFRMPAREEQILRAFDACDSFFKDSGFRGDALVGLTTAFREAVRNAEKHGCEEDPSRAISVEALLDSQKMTVIVEDPGNGFDHAEYRASLSGAEPVQMARSRHDQGGIGGLGIYLMDRCADRLEYNDRGNRVTLTKMRDAQPESGGASAD